MEKVKFAVIGVGGIGKYHAEIIKMINETELVAIADINEKVGRRIASNYKVAFYKDYLDMIEKEELDAVSICTPHFSHDEIAVNCAKCGVNILVEKPMALSIKRADRMIQEAKKNSVKLGVVFQWRTYPVYLAAKKVIEKGLLGDLIFSFLNFYCYRSQKYYLRGFWRGKWAYEGGGVLITQAIHAIDIYQWLINTKFKRLFAYIGTLGHEIEVEDIAIASIEFENNAKGSIFATSLSALPGSETLPDMIIQGEEGALIIRRYLCYEKDKEIKKCNILFYEFDIPVREAIMKSVQYEKDLYPKAKIKEIELKRGKGGHEEVIRDFALAILEDRNPMVPGEEGRKSLEIVNAIIYSGIKRVEVNFPLNADEYEKLIQKLAKISPSR